MVVSFLGVISEGVRIHLEQLVLDNIILIFVLYRTSVQNTGRRLKTMIL